MFQRRYPSVQVEADRIFVADGHVWTSAGVTAGIDLALALIEADEGIELARAVARELVVPHRRPGGQSQFSAASLMEPASDRIRIALAFAREHLAEPLPLGRLADAARLSPRQLGRLFRQETGTTPARAIERLRVEAAQRRLQDRRTGSGDPRRALLRRAWLGRGLAGDHRLRHRLCARTHLLHRPLWRSSRRRGFPRHRGGGASHPVAGWHAGGGSARGCPGRCGFALVFPALGAFGMFTDVALLLTGPAAGAIAAAAGYSAPFLLGGVCAIAGGGIVLALKPAWGANEIDEEHSAEGWPTPLNEAPAPGAAPEISRGAKAR